MAINSRTMNYLIRHPAKLLRYQMTGQLPRTITPASPLIALLEKISAHDRGRIRGVSIGPDLGYSPVTPFATAEQLYRWLKPRRQMMEHESWPAESRRYKSFHKRLHFDDLLRHVSDCPDDIRERYQHL